MTCPIAKKNSINWIPIQGELIAANWGGAMKNYYPFWDWYWSTTEGQMNAHKKLWHYLEAVEAVNWNANFTSDNLKVLDLGCGTGWLSAFLSKFRQIKSIDALDSDRKMLDILLPEIVKEFDGEIGKIQPVIGFFSPLPVADNTYDLIVSSSAVHHADNMVDLFNELKRVLKPDGKLIILNETPHEHQAWLELANSTLANMGERFNNGTFKDRESKVSPSGILYDPYLGDVAYSYEHWKCALDQSGFNYEIQKTKYYPYKSSFRPDDGVTRLTHFICSIKQQNSEVADSLNKPISDWEDNVLNFFSAQYETKRIEMSKVIRLVDIQEKNGPWGDYVFIGESANSLIPAAVTSLIKNRRDFPKIFNLIVDKNTTSPQAHTPNGLKKLEDSSLITILGDMGFKRDLLSVKNCCNDQLNFSNISACIICENIITAEKLQIIIDAMKPGGTIAFLKHASTLELLNIVSDLLKNFNLHEDESFIYFFRV